MKFERERYDDTCPRTLPVGKEGKGTERGKKKGVIFYPIART